VGARGGVARFDGPSGSAQLLKTAGFPGQKEHSCAPPDPTRGKMKSLSMD
jgi:hypothetical protein